MEPRMLITKKSLPEQEGGGNLFVFSVPETGLIVGTVHHGQGRFGEDPQKSELRCFIDDESAVRFIKQKCRDLIGRDDVDFETRNDTPTLLVPRVAMPRH